MATLINASNVSPVEFNQDNDSAPAQTAVFKLNLGSGITATVTVEFNAASYPLVLDDDHLYSLTLSNNQ